MSLEKKFKKKPSVLPNFCFLVNFVRPTGPMVNMVTRHTGGLSQLPVVEMSLEKKNKRKNLVFWPTFVFWSILSDTLVPWSPGTQVGFLIFQWSKWARKKILRKNLVFRPTFVFWSFLSDTLVPWSPGTQVGYLSFQWLKWAGKKILRKNLVLWPTLVF